MVYIFCYNKIRGIVCQELEEKLGIINEVLVNCKSTEQVVKEYDISGGMLRGWTIKYNKYDLDALENKKKPGNPLCKYSNRKIYLKWNNFNMKI